MNTAKTPSSRRAFLKQSSIIAATAAASASALGANEKIALGVIGTGGRGQRLLKAITNIPDFQVAALCDLKSDRVLQAAEICDQYKPTVRTYNDLWKMLEWEKLDACIVATEEGNHGKCVIPVLESGLHCFSEKPMDTTVDKVDAIVKAAKKSKGIYQVGFQRRYVPTFQAAVSNIQNGEYGKITHLQGAWQWSYGVGGRYLDMEESGGWFLAQACHHVDAMVWVMNAAPKRCVAMGLITQDNQKPPVPTSEDHSALVYEFGDNVLFSYSHIMNCCEEFSYEKLWVCCEEAGIDLPKGMVYPLPEKGEPKSVGEASPDWDEGTYQELEAFAKHIKNSERPLSNEDTGRISTLTGIMGRLAMHNKTRDAFEPRIIRWEDLGTMI